MAQLLRYGESNFGFVSSCNGLRVFAAVWPYSPGSQSRCRTVRFTVRFEFIRPVARLRHLIGQLKLTLSQARNRQTVTCAASLVLCVAHTLIGRTRCPWQACSGGPRSLSADAVGFVQSAGQSHSTGIAAILPLVLCRARLPVANLDSGGH